MKRHIFATGQFNMKRPIFALAAVASLAGGGDAFAQAAGCVTPGLPAPYQRAVGGSVVFVRPIGTVVDAAVDDAGTSSGGDGLTVYCVTKTRNAPRGSIAVCLTEKGCSWR